MKKCGTDFMHQEWGITCTSGESIKVRRNIPKDKLTILDRHLQRSPVPNNNFLLQWMHRVFGKNMYRM